MKIAIVMGTRPEIIKLAPIIRKIPKKNCSLIFTGQHYDYKMGLKFVDELGLRKPDYSLQLSHSIPNIQMAQIISKLSKILQEIKPDTTVVQGDTNTVLASSICSLKLGIPISHVESGLRSFDWRMPEEHNRIATDHISEILFAPTNNSKKNLQSEKVHGKIFVTGNTVIDSISMYSKISSKKSKLILDGDFILLTLHRAENVDDKKTLSSIIKVMIDSQEKIIFPIHPRTKKRLDEFNLMSKLSKSKTIKIIDSTGYFEMLELMKKSSFILTDSGGIQEEATASQIRKKTFVLRKTTDRPEAVKTGFSELIGTNPTRIKSALRQGFDSKIPHKKSPFGDGKAAEKILKVLYNSF